MARKYYFDENYFENIDTEDKAYFLGLLMADGYVATSERFVTIALKESDVKILNKFKKAIKSEAPLSNKKNCTQKVLTLCSKKLVNDLKNLGMTRNKTFTLKFPNIQEEYIRHFIRGYFDGDGCISINKDKHNVRVNFVGTEDMLKHIVEIFVKECGAHKPDLIENSNNNGNIVYSVQWGNIYTCHKIYNYLYKGANIYLDRKLEKFDTIYCLE